MLDDTLELMLPYLVERFQMSLEISNVVQRRF